jgi:FkbM family methyltransferase
MTQVADDRLISDGQWVQLALPSGRSLDILVPPAGDLVADHVRRAGSFFPPTFELALGLLGPGMVLLDLGAHLGTLSLAAAAHGCGVLAVEASPRNIAFLRASARANGFDDLTVVPVAVSSQPGPVRFRPDGAWGQVTTGWSPGVIEVPAQPVSTMLTESGVDRVDLVKLDVEGSEIGAIEGMTTLLSQPEAPPVVYESNAHTLRMFGATPEDLLGRFEDLGYTNYLVGDRVLIPATRGSFQPETCIDYLAVKGRCDPPAGWRIREPRTQHEIAWAVAKESTSHVVDARAQIARSLEHAPEWLLDRRDVRLALTALTLDPDAAVSRAAEWRTVALRRANRGSADMSRRLRDLAESGRALHDRIAHIRIRWGTRP